jgi:hypothetical protein
VFYRPEFIRKIGGIMTEKEGIKNMIEKGEPCVYAYENADLEKMRSEGDSALAAKVERVLELVDEINGECGVE